MTTEAEATTTQSSDNVNESTSNSIREKQAAGTFGPDVDEEPEYLTGWRLTAVMSTILLSTLLAALDIGIVATAIPKITDEYRRLDDVGWYGSACFLLVGVSSPMWGKLYKYFSGKSVYLISIVLFMIGSIVAAAAPNSAALIVGRAIQGWGCSGTLAGSVLMINYVAEPGKRPVLIGVWMGVFMASTIVGPLIGGAFTSEVTWRWCFWINLPVGGPIIVMVFFFLNIPKHIKPVPATWREIIRQLDFPGFTLLLISLVCYTLALQWGGQSKPWNDGSVIATLVMWIVLAIAFVAVEKAQGDYAMVPLRLLKPRLTWSYALYGHIANFSSFQIIFYLPIYFQSIHGQSAVTSGVNSIPYMVFFAAGAMFSGFLIGKTHFLQPFTLISGLAATAGAALLYTLDINSGKARYIGPQVLFGFGIGLGNQVPQIALQAFAKPADIASTAAIMLMCNALAGAIYVTAASSVFNNLLLQTLANTAPNLDAGMVLATGASEIHRTFSGSDLSAVLNAYMTGTKDAFAFALAGASCSVLLSLLIPLKKLPNHDKKPTDEKPPTSDST